MKAVTDAVRAARHELMSVLAYAHRLNVDYPYLELQEELLRKLIVGVEAIGWVDKESHDEATKAVEAEALKRVKLALGWE
jgi:hypothetical protein